MEYVGGQPDEGCFICRALEAPASSDPANLVVWRPPHGIVILNRFPYNSGHVLVAPDDHVGSLTDLDPARSAGLMAAIQQVLRVLERTLTPEGFNVGVNLGRVAGAGVPGHVHVHVVPRWAGDTNFMPVVAEVKVVNEHLQRTQEKLSAAFAAS